VILSDLIIQSCIAYVFVRVVYQYIENNFDWRNYRNDKWFYRSLDVQSCCSCCYLCTSLYNAYVSP